MCDMPMPGCSTWTTTGASPWTSGPLESNGLVVSAIGLGCTEHDRWLQRQARPARDDLADRRGRRSWCHFFDTAEIYGPYANEELVGEDSRHTEGQGTDSEFGADIDPVERKPRGRVTSRPDVIKGLVDGSLQRLRVDAIDLYYQHRVDPEVPIKDVAGEGQNTHRSGKVKTSSHVRGGRRHYPPRTPSSP